MSDIAVTLPDAQRDFPGILIRRIFGHISRAGETFCEVKKNLHSGAAFYERKEGFASESAPDEKREGHPSGTVYDHMERASDILDRFGNSILRMAYSYLHNMSDAEDILQDVLLQYLKTKPALADEAHEKAWLLKVACNLSKNRIKYNRLRETDELMEELVSDEKEDLSFVWEAVKSLPVKYSEVIHLFYEEGFSTSQIATVLGRKEATVRSDLKRGREKLKEILKEAYDFE